MQLMTKAEYARRCGVSRQAITRFVTDWGIPTYGPRGLIEAEELDRVYCPRIDAGRPQLRTMAGYLCSLDAKQDVQGKLLGSVVRRSCRQGRAPRRSSK